MLAPLSSSRDIIGMFPFKVLMCRQAKPGVGRQEKEPQSTWSTLRHAKPSQPQLHAHSAALPGPCIHSTWSFPQTGHQLCTRLPQDLTLPVLELQVLVVLVGLGRALRWGCALQQLLGTLQLLLLTGQVQRRVAVAVLQPGVHSLVNQCLDHAGLLQVHGEVERSLEKMWAQKLGEGGMTHRTPSVMSHASLAAWVDCHEGAHPCSGVKCG